MRDGEKRRGGSSSTVRGIPHEITKNHESDAADAATAIWPKTKRNKSDIDTYERIERNG